MDTPRFRGEVESFYEMSAKQIPSGISIHHIEMDTPSGVNISFNTWWALLTQLVVGAESNSPTPKSHLNRDAAPGDSVSTVLYLYKCKKILRMHILFQD
jgi:hypothetical protein